MQFLQFVGRFKRGIPDGWDYPPHFVINGTIISAGSERQSAVPRFWKFASQIVAHFSTPLLPLISRCKTAMKRMRITLIAHDLLTVSG